MISQADLKAAVDYDPVTGVFTWKTFRNAKAPAGTVVGSPDKDGYLRTVIDGTHYKLHRLAFLYMTGETLTEEVEVDHRNGVRSCNIWTNLRKATVQQNRRNHPKRVTNTSGFVGVSWSDDKGKWRATVAIDGKTKHLGYFEDPEEASAKYEQVSQKLHGEFHRTQRI